MSLESLKQYYKDLLIMQYKGKPKAEATIEALTELSLMDDLAVDLVNAFNINTAEGSQLDVIGDIVGVERRARDFTQIIELDDDDFRTLIRVAIIKNNFGSSLFDIDDLLNTFFPGTILCFDFANMSMGYFFDSAVGSEALAEVFVKNNYLPKPMGVELSALIYSNNIDNFFGYRTYDLPGHNNSGYNSYIDYDENSPWLSYEDAIFPA